MRREAKDEAMRWFTQAKDEFKDADDLRTRQRFYLALFHFQEATEKALKAFLYQNVSSEEVFFTHSIYELIEMATGIDKSFKSLKDASKLDQYYIPTRYPNGLPGSVPSQFYHDPNEAKEAMQLAKKVIVLVEKKL